MRSALLLLSLLLCVAAVLAVKDDVACVVHSDDCGRCVSNGCNWCSDGYCVSKESDICEAHKVATECSVQPIVQNRQRGQRQSVICEALYTCAACAAQSSCSICRDPTTHVPKCSSNAQCIASVYNAPFEWWIPRASLQSAAFERVAACPTKLIPADDSPTLNIRFTNIQAVKPGDEVPESLFVGTMLAFIARYFGSGIVTDEHISVQSITLNPATKRQSLDPNVREATVLMKFADGNSFTAQGLAATFLAGFTDATVTLASGSKAITSAPYTPTVGAGSAVNRGNGNNGLDLSKGALAGIIIGCVIGGALIVALIAWLILRRRDAYPQAFRSPAAAYRP